MPTWMADFYGFHVGEYTVHLGNLFSDLTRPHPKWWFSKGNPLISGKSAWWNILIWPDTCILWDWSWLNPNHVWYIWCILLHLADFYGFHVGKLGLILTNPTRNSSKQATVELQQLRLSLAPSAPSDAAGDVFLSYLSGGGDTLTWMSQEVSK